MDKIPSHMVYMVSLKYFETINEKSSLTAVILRYEKGRFVYFPDYLKNSMTW